MAGHVTNNPTSATRAALSANAIGLSALEQQALQGLSGDDRARMMAQMALAKQQETMSHILSKLMMMSLRKPQQGGSVFNSSSFGGSVKASSVGSSSLGGIEIPTSNPNVMTQSQQRLLASVDLEDRPRMEAQFALQNQQEQVAFISNMMKKRNEIAMSIINNLK